MPRRYGADGTRLWNGKTPEEFTEADAYRFMAETEAVLQKKELMDDPAQPAPASGKEEFYLSKKDDVLLTPEQIAAVWKIASARMIAEARGDVKAFVKNADPRSVFRSTELPEILRNEEIKTINGVDKFSFAESYF